MIKRIDFVQIFSFCGPQTCQNEWSKTTKPSKLTSVKKRVDKIRHSSEILAIFPVVIFRMEKIKSVHTSW